MSKFDVMGVRRPNTAGVHAETILNTSIVDAGYQSTNYFPSATPPSEGCTL